MLLRGRHCCVHGLQIHLWGFIVVVAVLIQDTRGYGITLNIDIWLLLLLLIPRHRKVFVELLSYAVVHDPMHELVDVAKGRLGKRLVQDPRALLGRDELRVACQIVIITGIDLQHNFIVSILIKHLSERQGGRRFGSIHQYHVY